jgi:hypothetical protein
MNQSYRPSRLHFNFFSRFIGDSLLDSRFGVILFCPGPFILSKVAFVSLVSRGVVCLGGTGGGPHVSKAHRKCSSLTSPPPPPPGGQFTLNYYWLGFDPRAPKINSIIANFALDYGAAEG